jgi:SAM-dependent methyltransferase
MPDFGSPQELFRETARYYANFRPPYPYEAIDLVASRFRLDEGSHVIDLGCGTGQVSIPLAQSGARVYAIDPAAEMLAMGREAAARAGVSGIEWLQGDDQTFAELLPRHEFALCCMGSSFHWMQRDYVLEALDALIAPEGGVALLGNAVSVWSEDAAWAEVCREVIVQFLGPGRRAGDGTYVDPPERHETVLGRSAFTMVETHNLVKSWPMTVDAVVGLQLSSSYASPALLGKRIDTFKDVLAKRLYMLAPGGVFEWLLKTEVILATR